MYKAEKEALLELRALEKANEFKQQDVLRNEKIVLQETIDRMKSELV